MTIRSRFVFAMPLLWLASAPLAAQQVVLPPELEQRPALTSPELDSRDIERRIEERKRRESAERVEIPALQGGAAEGQRLPDDERTFVLRTIRFSSSHFIASEELEQIATDYVGKPITFGDLNAMLDAINALYASRRLLTARAIIPPQTIAEGELRVVLVEAKLSSVEWAQEPRGVPRDFYTERVELRQDEILNTAELMESIQRLNDTTTGPQLSASLAPGDTFGTTQVQLQPVEPNEREWLVYANNYGSESSGEYLLGLSGHWYSPAGRADNMRVNLVAAEGRLYGDLEYRLPVNRQNGELFAGFSRNTLEIIEGPYRDLQIEGESQEWRLGFMQPWWLNERWLISGRAEWAHSDSETTLEGGFKLSETSIDSARLIASVQFREGPLYWRYEQRLEFATTEEQLSGITGDYQLTRGDLFLQRRFSSDSRLLLRSGWQYASDDTLPSSLLFQIGGPSSVRGYDAGVLTAAHGLDLGLEWRRRFNQSWEGLLLLDAGYVLDEELPKDTISSVGAGVEYGYAERLVVQAIYAAANDTVVPEQDDGKFMLQMSWRI